MDGTQDPERRFNRPEPYPGVAIEQHPPGMGRENVPRMVIVDLAARAAAGCVKYNMPLKTHNGRDALLDAYQEALDLCLYLRQALQERDDRQAKD